MILVVLAIVILGIVLVCADGVHSAKQIKPAIERKTYGKGTRTEELDIRIGSDDKGKTEKIRSKVEISERRYTEKEVQELFDRIIRRMDRMIQGENVLEVCGVSQSTMMKQAMENTIKINPPVVMPVDTNGRFPYFILSNREGVKMRIVLLNRVETVELKEIHKQNVKLIYELKQKKR